MQVPLIVTDVLFFSLRREVKYCAVAHCTCSRQIDHALIIAELLWSQYQVDISKKKGEEKEKKKKKDKGMKA